MEIARENGARAFRHLRGLRIVLGPRARRFRRTGRTHPVRILRVHRFGRSGIRNGACDLFGPRFHEVFYDQLAGEQRRIATILGDYHEMLPLIEEEQERFDQTRACVACNKPFSDLDQKIMHHNHRTGKFIAAFCNGCNLQIKNREDNFFVPVVFHNLKNYDFVAWKNVLF
jgi:hypothetical protein